MDRLSRPFIESDLCALEWKVILPYIEDVSSDDVRLEAAGTHGDMLNILHGEVPLALEEERIIQHLVPLFALLVYYGCLLFVKKTILDKLFGMELFWKAVQAAPIPFLRLAVKLESSELYFDAFRQICAKAPQTYQLFHAHGCSWEVQQLAAHLAQTTDDYYAKTEPHLREQQDTIAHLRKALRKLSLVKDPAQRRTYISTGRRSWLSSLRNTFRGGLKASAPNEMSLFLARSLYGEWLTEQEVGEEAYLYGACATGSLSNAVHILQTLAESDAPGALINLEDLTNIVTRFQSGAIVVKQVYDELACIVAEANELIEKAFPEGDITVNGKVVTYQRSRYDVSLEAGSTYFGIVEEKVPWKWADPGVFWKPAILEWDQNDADCESEDDESELVGMTDE